VRVDRRKDKKTESFAAGCRRASGRSFSGRCPLQGPNGA